MIYKKRDAPKNLIGLTTLENRLQSTSMLKEKVKEALRKEKSGYGGELNFDKHLLEFMPDYPHAILHDVTLQQDGIYFQMDSLLITPACIYIFEVKNIGGKLIFMENPDRFVRESSTGERKAMQSPIAQLDRKKYFLRKWLKAKNIHVPIEPVVALAYTNEIELVDMHKYPITFTYQIPYYLNSLTLAASHLTEREIVELAQCMIKDHHVYDPFPLIQKWGFKHQDFHLGVQCSSCAFFGMKVHYQKWRCPRCWETGRDNHIAAIKDWFYLIDCRMTNRQFREFVCVHDQDIAKRLLLNPVIRLEGRTRGSYYVLAT